MKRILLATLALTLFAIDSNCEQQSDKLDAKISQSIADRLCPLPKSLALRNATYKLSKDSSVEISTIETLSESDKQRLKKIIKDYWRLEPTLKFNTEQKNKNFGLEGFSIKISDKISISGNDALSLRQALKTLRQMAEASKDGDGFVFQQADIDDFATLKFRGIHLCVFSETTPADLEKFVRLASYYKFNYVVIEPWGVFPYKSHPEFAYEDKKFDRQKLKEIIRLCRELDITPIPQVSVLGHGTQSRVSTSKHAVLANHPELEDIFEVYGWSYCLTNPKTDKILKDLIAEIYEFFDRPPYMHIGCDEAYDMGTCYSCRNHNIAQLLTAHLKKYNDFVKQLGARSIIWHDMLLDRQDPRWKNHVACGTAEIAKALDTLPRDIIVADWQYSYQDKKQTKFDTPKHFKDAGYDVLVCPWEVRTGIIALAKTAKEENHFGFLQTTWHYLYGRKYFTNFFYIAGDAAWNGGANSRDSKHLRESLPLIKHLWQIGSDMENISYETNGNSHNQIINSVLN